MTPAKKFFLPLRSTLASGRQLYYQVSDSATCADAACPPTLDRLTDPPPHHAARDGGADACADYQMRIPWTQTVS